MGNKNKDSLPGFAKRAYPRLSSEASALLKATASEDMDKAIKAQRALAAALTEPLRKAVFDDDNLGSIYTRQMLEPGAQSRYSLDFVRPGEEDLNHTAFTMPKQGRVPERHVEGDELWVPTYRIANSIDWSLQYARDARWDVVARALDVFRAGFTRKLNLDGWHTILAAAHNRHSQGLSVVQDSVAVDGQFTKELVAQMKTAMTRNAGGNGNAGNLTDLYVSLEAIEDIRAWDVSEIDEVTRREIFLDEDGVIMIYGVRLHPMTELGVGQEYQDYLVNTLGRSLPGTDEEFCVGLDLSTNDSFVMPVREDLQVFEDDNLHRQGRAGFYGWMEPGFAVLDNRRTILGAF